MGKVKKGKNIFGKLIIDNNGVCRGTGEIVWQE